MRKGQNTSILLRQSFSIRVKFYMAIILRKKLQEKTDISMS